MAGESLVFAECRLAAGSERGTPPARRENTVYGTLEGVQSLGVP